MKMVVNVTGVLNSEFSNRKHKNKIRTRETKEKRRRKTK